MADAASIAMSSAALAAASSAQASARRAECQAIISGFEPKGADVTTMRGYASCVREVHGSGEPMSAGETAAAKALVCFVLICVVVCSICLAKDDGVEGALMGALLGLLIAMLAVAIGAGLLFVVAA